MPEPGEANIMVYTLQPLHTSGSKTNGVPSTSSMVRSEVQMRPLPPPHGEDCTGWMAGCRKPPSDSTHWTNARRSALLPALPLVAGLAAWATCLSPRPVWHGGVRQCVIHRKPCIARCIEMAAAKIQNEFCTVLTLFGSRDPPSKLQCCDREDQPVVAAEATWRRVSSWPLPCDAQLCGRDREFPPSSPS